MSIETEIKLMIKEHDLLKAKDVLNNTENAEFIGEQLLINQYFDTGQIELRHWNTGLRIRRFKNRKEQTVKTAGKVVNGLHRRPEFSVDIPFESDVPDLALFPATIWPAGADIEGIQKRLEILFETNFVRTKWHTLVGDSKIEMALDVGEILCDDKKVKIRETELELLEGCDADLFRLAKSITAHLSARAGNDSKAKRGYELALS